MQLQVSNLGRVFAYILAALPIDGQTCTLRNAVREASAPAWIARTGQHRDRLIGRAKSSRVRGGEGLIAVEARGGPGSPGLSAAVDEAAGGHGACPESRPARFRTRPTGECLDDRCAGRRVRPVARAGEAGCVQVP